MGWNEVDKKHKKQIDKNFVSCKEPYERQTIRKIIKEEFPYFGDAMIDAAIESRCKSIPTPRPREKFMQCLRQRLG